MHHGGFSSVSISGKEDYSLSSLKEPMTYCRWTLLIHLRKYPRALMQGGRPAKLAWKHSCFSLFTWTIIFFLLNSSPKKTATRKNNFHKGAAETSGRAVRQNKISWHLHERGNRHENKFARKSSTGENTVFEAGGGGYCPRHWFVLQDKFCLYSKYAKAFNVNLL